MYPVPLGAQEAVPSSGRFPATNLTARDGGNEVHTGKGGRRKHLSPAPGEKVSLPGLRYKGEVGANVAGFGSRDLKGLLGLERPMNKARIP